MADLTKTGYIDPWSAGQPGFDQFYGGLYSNLYAGGPPTPPTPGEQVAPLSQMQQQGIGRLGAFGQPGGTGGQVEQFSTQQLGAGLNMGEVAGYADNPYIDDMITASLRDPYRALTEQTLPGIGMGTAATGGGSSSRSDIASGIAERGYADRATDVGAQVRSNAYGMGLETAMGTRGQDLDYATLAQGIGLGNIDAQMMGGGMQQEQDQLLRNANMGNFMYGANAPWQWAQNYAGIASPPAYSFGDVYQEDQTPDFNDQLWSFILEGGLGSLGGLQGGTPQPTV